MALKYQTCEAYVQDEFNGYCDEQGNLITGKIIQIELYNPHDASEIVGWFYDSPLAEKVCRLLNKAKKR